MALTLPTASNVTLLNIPGQSFRGKYRSRIGPLIFSPSGLPVDPIIVFYFQALATCDVYSGGTPISMQNGSSPYVFLGNLNNQTLLNFGASAGYWVLSQSTRPLHHGRAAPSSIASQL